MKSVQVAAESHKKFILDKLTEFQSRRLLIVGDLGLDEYVVGEVKRISPEAPVPVVEVENEEVRLGLSGNVAQNITSLGGKAVLVSVVGQDAAADTLRRMLDKAKVQAELLIDGDRPTTRKLRVMAAHHHVVRVDYEKRNYLSSELVEKLVARVKDLLPQVDGVILQDYAKGLLHREAIQKIISLTHAAGKKVLVDPHRTTPLSYYEGSDLMTPNYDESLKLAGIESDEYHNREELLIEVGKKLLSGMKSQQVVITLGKKGMHLVENGGTAQERMVDLPTYARQVFDVTGAGDTVIATMALAWLSGFSLEQSCVTANFAAGVVVAKTGCVPCTVDELKRFILSH